MTPEVKVKITADGTGVDREVGKVNKNLDGLKKQSDVLSGSLAKLGGVVAGAFTVGALTNFLRTATQAADQLDAMSQRLSASASGLQTLQIAASQAGGSTEALNNAISRMSVSLGDALAGTSKIASDALARLNLNARDLAGLKTDEAFRRIAGALSETGNSYERASIAQAIFGKGAKDLAEFFAVAPGQISETEQALARAGAALDDIDVAKIGAMNDDLAMQSQIVQNLGIKFSANLSPAIGVAADSFGNLLTNMGGATEAGKGFGVVMVTAIKMVEAGVYGLAAVFETLRATVAVILAAITNGVGNLIGILASAAEIANLGIADNLRAASDAALLFGSSLNSVSASAWENAKAAGAAALQAGADVLNAAAIFDEKSREFEARAAAAAARAGAVQGAATGIGAGAATAGATTDRSGLLTVSKESLGKIDPQLDPEVLRQTSINDTLAAVQDAHNATMLGKIEAFEQTKLGMLLTNADLMQQIEFNKNATLGDAMSSLVGMAIQQGGALGKAGKALAIAQTVWSTGQAIMKAMAEVPWPANIAAAANIAAMGVAQLSNIRRTNVGSGGSIVSGRGGGGSAAASPALSDNVGPTGQPLEQQSAAQVHIHGNIFSSSETADWIIEQIRSAVDSRDVVFVSSTSRQAMELRG
jgi:hypothetical protein